MSRAPRPAAKSTRRVAKAARRLSRKPPPPAAAALASHDQALLHELRVYTEEIEVQNEELVRARTEVEEARDRFADLYDFAPIGYLSLDQNGVIKDANFAAARLIGRDRTSLRQIPLSVMVQRDDRERLRRYLVQVVHAERNQTSRPIDIELKRDIECTVRLLTRARRDRRRIEILMAMVDVTQERRLERERVAALAHDRARSAELAKEIADRTAAEARVKTLLERLVSIQEEERRRLSRNLHDHLGQQLTALRLAIGAVKERARTEGATNSRMGVIESIVSDLDRDIDRLAWDLRPATLDDMGLSAALATLVREWRTMTGITAEFHLIAAPAAQPRIASDVESHVYRIVQEALTNVAKHAGATHVSVLLKQESHQLSVIIEDDGRGFPQEHPSPPRAGMGLLSMSERAALAGGAFEVESLAGRGSTVFVKIPLRASSPV